MNIELKILDKEFYCRKLVNSDSGQLQTDHNYEICALPSYATSGSCAVDLYATRDYVLAPQERVKIPTGIAIHLGSGYFGMGEGVKLMAMIVPRSGLGTQGLVLANTLGLIDSDYQGEVIISAWNNLPAATYSRLVGQLDLTQENSLYIKAGDRIAQMCIIPVIVANWVIVDEFTEKTDRNDGGFSSTGR